MNKLILIIWLNGAEIANDEWQYTDGLQCVKHSTQLQQIAQDMGATYFINCLEIQE